MQGKDYDDNYVEHLGLGVMIKMLGGNRESVETLQSAIGKRITGIGLEEQVLRIAFEDGSKIKIFDDGQSCCEARYMRTDDDLLDYIGTTFTGIELRDAPTITDKYGEPHEVQFLLVNTDKGTFTMSSHNEHNGYYGGFWIVVQPD